MGILGNLNFFFIDNELIIPKNLYIKIKKNVIIVKSSTNSFNLYFKNIILFKYLNKLFFSSSNEIFLNLYFNLFNNKLKGLFQDYKKTIFLNGIGFKFIIKNRYLILHLGLSHDIKIFLPKSLKLINIKQNKLTFSSNNLVKLMQFLNYLKSFKKIEPYKKKGLYFNNDIIIQKEGKKK